MADEQTPQSDLIDDAIRHAERQLEEKLDALRRSALGESTPPAGGARDDVAVLRPTGGSANISPRDAEMSAPEASQPSPAATHIASDPDDDFSAPAPATGTGVSGIVAGWEDDDAAPAPSTGSENGNDGSSDRSWETPERAWDTPETLGSSWSSGGGAQPAALSSSSRRPVSMATEDEMQFWAHTRTALRNLQQVADGIPGQVVGDVTNEMERVLREEMAAPAAALRIIQHQVQQGFPKIGERVDEGVQHAQDAVASIREVRDQLPMHMDRTSQEVRDAVRQDLEQTSRTLQGTLQKDSAQLEQSIATNVTRMAQAVGEGVTRVEHDVESLAETVGRFKRDVHSDFDRIEGQLRGAIQQVEENLTEQLSEPAAAIRRFEQELPAQFEGVQQAVVEQVQSSQHELSAVLATLVDANRAALDRIAALASTLDEERARRTEDVELVVDTVATGWEGLASAVKALYDQSEQTSQRVVAIEERLSQMRDLEAAVNDTMGEIRTHVRDLQPAPVVVTVSHPEAEVRNSTRSGWLPDEAHDD